MWRRTSPRRLGLRDRGYLKLVLENLSFDESLKGQKDKTILMLFKVA